jgi:hypothetical protein
MNRPTALVKKILPLPHVNNFPVLIIPDPNIQEYLNNIIIQNNDSIYVKEYFSPSPKSMSFQSSSLDDQISERNFNEDLLFSTGDYNPVNNANLLKDIENLIQNMERKQTQDNDSSMLENIDNILSNIKLNESRPHSPQSNLSAEPIRMKSPIMLPTRNDERISSDVRNIIDDIRNFVSLNIQEIVPDLVNQVEQELTTNLHDEVNGIAMSNLEDFLRNRHDEEFNERNFSPNETENSQNLALEDFLRNRHEEEFDEINASLAIAETEEKVCAGDDNDFHDFLRTRHEQEYDERNNNDFHINLQSASHDSIIAEGGANSGENLIGAASSSSVGEKENVVEENNSIELPVEIVTNGVGDDDQEENKRQAPSKKVEAAVVNQQLEPLKYKSSFNLRILKQPSKRTKSERDFKKRNSLILENVLLGKTTMSSKKTRPKSLALNNETESIGLAENSPSVSKLNDVESNINHPVSLISGNIESKSRPNLINGNVRASEENLSLLPYENASNEAIGTTVVEVIINDEIETSLSSETMNYTVNSLSAVIESFPQSSSNASLPAENDPSKTPLSELVEDTQRLIKQMKDEINAIYVSDDELSSSERTEYSDNWADEFDEEEMEDEYTDEEESEYEDWSGDFVESEDAPDEIILEETFIMDANIDTEIRDNSEIPDIIIGDAPDAVNDTENADSESVVHGKLELTPMSSNQFTVDANIETGNDFAGGTSLNDNGANLNNSTSLQHSQEANDNTNAQVASSSVENNGIINNEIKEQTNSIKEIVNDAINDVISAISFDGKEYNVSQGNDNNYSEIAGGSQPPNEHDSAIIDSAMNNSPNTLAETIPKVPDANDDSITSGNLLNDDGNIEKIIIPLAQQEKEEDEAASNAESENMVALNNDEKSDQLKNDVKSAEAEFLEDVETDESQKPLIFEVNTADNSIEQASNASGNNPILLIPEKNDTNEIKTHGNIDKASVEQLNNEMLSSSYEVALSNIQTNDAEDFNHKTEQSNNQTNEKQTTEDFNQKPKGAVAKSKIPAKVKNAKRKNSTSEKIIEVDSQNSMDKSKSKSSSPEKIKESPKKQDNPETKNGSKQPLAGRKSSFDNSLRKKSVPTAFGLLATSNVKNLQKEFLNKSNVVTTTVTPTKTQLTKLKPSKLSTPKKELASTFANKLTKLITPSSSAKNNSEKSIENQKEQRDHSKDVVPEKKYMEHCFSDEYPTTDDDEKDEDMKKSSKSFSIKKPSPSESDDETSDVRRTISRKLYRVRYCCCLHLCFFFSFTQQKVNRFLIEGLVPNHLAAELAVQLIELKYPKESALWVSAQASTIDEAVELLQQECELCADKHPLNQMITMLKCEHQCCTECASNYFTIQVRF